MFTKTIEKWVKSRNESHFKKCPSHLKIKDGWGEINWHMALVDAADLNTFDVACILFEPDPEGYQHLSEISHEETILKLKSLYGYDCEEVIEDAGEEAAAKSCIGEVEGTEHGHFYG